MVLTKRELIDISNRRFTHWHALRTMPQTEPLEKREQQKRPDTNRGNLFVVRCGECVKLNIGQTNTMSAQLTVLAPRLGNLRKIQRSNSKILRL
jgi:hypothetical protein